ncbi:hypothetical protein [Saccharothrix coeruleofusca]|uniref:Uncharacterized protein n=1 Tax=Saccharothrix coeruleofusca TaxID=33919 RepID=A0A918EET9_9PSEU|nr:hypothetical protein [Saccharothrix coeruleofusca]MBP2335059.1 hypothetical protein [Saccharothrix coeruleofusca]GGP68865.1 hypothetical protein GCM10010185_47310 [Saccharothrix coeruleofusca]
MSAPTEDRGQLSHPVLGDLELWYETFLVYAATAPAGNPHFPTAHVIEAEFDAQRVQEGLAWFEKEYGQLLGPGFLPDLATMRRALAAAAETPATRSRTAVVAHRHPHVIADGGEVVLHAGTAVTLSGGGLEGTLALDYEGVGVSDEGSPCHNFWHWLNGT